jgi:hypothetical protein
MQRYAFGFVNRRSRVQLSKAAPHLDEAPWPVVGFTGSHAQVPDSSTVPMAHGRAPAPAPRRLGQTLYWPVLT